MKHRTWRLLTTGLLAVAAVAINAAADDKDRAPKFRRGEEPKSSGGGSNPQFEAARDRLQQRNPGGIGNSKPSTNNGEGLPNNPPRNRLEQFRGQNQGGQVPTGNSAGNSGVVPNNQLRDRLEQFRGQAQTGKAPTGNNPGNPGVVPNNQLRDRLEQFRGQNEDGKGPARNNPGTPGLGNNLGNRPPRNNDPGDSGSAIDQLRERLKQQADQNQKNSGRGDLGNPPADRPNFDRFKDRLPGNANDGKSVDGSKPGLGQPGTNPKLEGLRERIEARKPDVSNPAGKTEADRLRDRLKGLNGGNNEPRLPGQAGNRGPDVDKPRFDITRNEGPRPNLKIERNAFDRTKTGKLEVADQIKPAERFRNADDLRRHLDRFRDQPDVQNVLKNTKLQLTDFSGAFQTKVAQGSFNNLARTNIGRQFNLDRQFHLFVQGDVGRQLNLNQVLIQNGGWQKRSIGPVYSRYTSVHFSSYYPGPSWCPSYCWTPNWSPWVQWCFWDYCRPIYDPRPFLCRPIYYYNPCPPIVYYEYPIWQPLPVVTCGTWVDVPLTIVPENYDVQLLAVRFVDPGHPEENLGPRYRVWIANRSNRPIQSPFNVSLVAANDENLVANLPQSGVTVEGMEPEGVVPVDIRLPLEANRLNRGPNGQRMPFTTLHVLVDSHGELPEVDERNNGLLIARGDILPVDPAAFSTEEPSAFPGDMVSLAGEGFGPEPGQLIVTVGDRQVPAEVHGWYDLGVYFKMPNLPVTGAGAAQILVIRGDGAASNPVTVELAGGI
ncbi:MAG: hypothetical protein SFV23_09525 [Planctomycetaceae bacterium]|nr:hypothetical protein [Planctomycetaceae bacterium]